MISMTSRKTGLENGREGIRDCATFGKRGHHIKTVVRTLATGESRSYYYYRPTKRRLLAEPGTEAFNREVRDAARQRTREVGGVSYVYFIQSAATGAIKIGKAADPSRRLQILQVGSPDVLTLLGWIRMDPRMKLERNIHGLFKADRIRGEWFASTPALLQLIQAKASL